MSASLLARSLLSGEMALQRVEAALKDVLAHALGDLVALLSRRVERGRPDRIGSVSVGDAAELQSGRVVRNRRRMLDDRIGGQEIIVREGDELFADRRAGCDLELAHGADVGRLPAALDLALDH